MSLQLIAKQMEAKGRKGDSMLVHMTTDEVAGLQKLAESAGGSLTVNPETGLVEANFLKRMLPTLVGLGVGAVTMNPLAGAAAGAAVGGYQAKENNQDVAMGALMGGLGGYGGASLAGGLGAAGAAGAAGTTAAGTTAAGTAVAGQQAGVLTAEQIAQQQLAEQMKQAAIAEGAKTSGAEAAQLAMQGNTTAAAGNAAAAQPAAAAVGTTPGTDVVVAKQPATYGENFENFKSGFGKMGTKGGRAAFGKEFGFTEAGAGLAPLMAPGERPGEEPVDDEMYSYTYNPGRTGAERTPTSSTAERKYFDSSYSPLRKIRASEYGFAEGGEATTADAATGEMSGASKAAFDYLMGNAPSSTAGLPALAAQAPASQASGITVGSDNMYAFDPATGVFVRNQNYVDPASGTRNAGLIGSLLSGGQGGSDYTDPNPGWTKMSDAEQARYYRENPTMAAITQAAQKAFGYTGLGFAQDAMNPGFSDRKAAIARGDFVDSDSRINSDGSYNYTGVNEGRSYNTPNGSAPAAFGSSHTSYGDQSGSLNGRDSWNSYDKKEGGLISLAKGGMASGGFVVPADVVSALGNGSTDAGLRSLNAMLGKVKPIKGKGDGLSDSIPTHIDGKQRARVADGEAYIDPKTVKRVGGAKKLYAMMDKIRAQAHGKTSQQRKVNPAKVMA